MWKMILSLYGVLGLSLALAGETVPRADRPNIIVILADDLGYGDLGCFGSEYVNTPVLDGLARNGLKLTDFYAGSTVCSPSRATLMTGRNHNRVGVYSWIPSESPMHLPEEEETIAEVLKKSGYQTAHFGKWHLSTWDIKDPSVLNPPLDRYGFDYWYATANNAVPSQKDPVSFVLNGKPLGKQEGFSCQLAADRAITWLEEYRSDDTPFYLQLWFTEPHEVVKAPEEYRERHLRNGLDEKHADYYGCIENMDNAIGRVMDKIREMGLSKETLVVFTSDNGSRYHESNGGLRGKKGDVWEGGIRVPAILYWDGYINAGAEEDSACGLVDFFATFCELTDNEHVVSLAKDGESLLSLIANKPFDRQKPVFTFHHFNSMASLRNGDWTLIGHLCEGHPEGPSAFRKEYLDFIRIADFDRFELYNVRNDPGQKTDVASQFPQVAEVMKEEMIAQYKDVVSDGPDWYR